MCEFNIIVKGQIVFKDVVYAVADEGMVIVKDIIGETKKFENYRISEIDVNKAQLILSSITT